MSSVPLGPWAAGGRLWPAGWAEIILPSSLGSAVSSSDSTVQEGEGITGAGPAEVCGDAKGPGASPFQGKVVGAGAVQETFKRSDLHQEVRLFPVVPRTRGRRHKLKH